MEMAEKKIKCVDCCQALKQKEHNGEDSFLKLKDRDGQGNYKCCSCMEGDRNILPENGDSTWWQSTARS